MTTTLGQLIQILESTPQDLRVPRGFSNPHSYRGYYDELAFEPAVNVTVAEMLADAKSVHGQTFEGWKGGEYTYSDHTPVWLAMQGRTGESLGETLLSYMLGHYGAVTHWSDCATHNEPAYPVGPCSCGGADNARALLLDIWGHVEQIPLEYLQRAQRLGILSADDLKPEVEDE